MGHDIWLKDDLRNIIKATTFLSLQKSKEVPIEQRNAFLLGYRTALSALAISLGLDNDPALVSALKNLGPFENLPSERTFDEDPDGKTDALLIGSENGAS
jgi:hypothetical protein